MTGRILISLHRITGLLTLSVIMVLITGSGVSAQSLKDLPYIVTLTNGDSFRCTIISYDDSTVVLRTQIDTVRVSKSLINGFAYVNGTYGKRPQHFFMPSASPNGPGGFVSNYELGLFYGGFGLGYGATITGGLTLVPGIPIEKQIFHAGGKITVVRDSTLEIALGGTFTWLTLQNPYSHAYVVGTIPLGTGRLSGLLMYKVGGKDFASMDFPFFGSLDSIHIPVHYLASLGAAVGFDAPAFGRDDMSWVGELWSTDLSNQSSILAMLGIRVMNEKLSADFGVVLSTALAVPIPVTRFEWRF